jgi:hypothetical protein
VTAQTWVALGASLLAAIVAVTVPLVTFRTTLRSDHTRWVQDERAKLYLDLIVEAVAEYEPFRVVDPSPERTEALLAPARERAQLGARVIMFASDRVRSAWMHYDEEVLAHRPAEELAESQRHELQRKLYDRFTALETAVRDEMGASAWRLL